MYRAQIFSLYEELMRGVDSIGCLFVVVLSMGLMELIRLAFALANRRPVIL